MNKITETLNALDEVKKAIQEAYASGYSNGKQRTWVGLADEERDEICLGDEGIARAIEEKLKEKNT